MVSDCGTVDSMVASDSRGPGFESSHRQILLNILPVNYLLKRRKYRQRGRDWPIFKRTLFNSYTKVDVVRLKRKFHRTATNIQMEIN